MKRRPICEDDLHAWADGRLDAERHAEVAAWLQTHPEAAAELAQWQALNGALHRAYDPVANEAIPARVHAAARARPRLPLRLAAALAWMTVGAFGGLGAGYQLGVGTPAAFEQAEPTLPRRAAVAHAVYTPEQRHPVEVGAEQEQHLVAWLSKRLGTRLHAPDLNAQGFRLIGGRLLSADAGPGAQFMYEDEHGERLTLYVSASPGEQDGTAFRHAEEDGIDVFWWTEAGFAYALSGRVGRGTLLPVAERVYHQLRP